MRQSKQPDLTKSRFVKGKRCPKALYLHTYSRELQTPLTPLEEKNIQAGKEVGQVAHEIFPNGILIKTLNKEEALKETQEAISNNALSLYEPAFRFKDTFIRIDILTRKTPNDPWNLYEVKATTYNKCTKEQKEEYRNDIGFQVWVLQQLNIPLDNISLMHLNRDYRHLDSGNLFTYKDYSQEILPVLSTLDASLSNLKSILSSPKEPCLSIGSFCEKPRTCPFKEYCWKNIPQPSLFNIPRCTKKWSLYEKGLVSIDSLSLSDFTSENQNRALECYKNNRRYFNHKTVTDLLNLYKYPLIFLDFEAIDYPIPKFSKTKPYQHIPFQFSCHIQKDKDSNIDHHEFISDSKDDPRKNFTEELIKTVPEKGSIVVYHKTYEKSRLKELAEAFPEYKDQLLNLIDRLIDLEDIFIKGIFYPEFLGSFSIKKVAPTILGETASYKNLEVGNGIEAMLAYKKLIELPPNSKEKNTLKKSMLEYCKQDTLLMVQLYEWLCKQVDLK
ncbi:MAG: hypothetical protein K940chlam4_00014 [Candidatus Anoxychlamydiales bacterium]|nr:hypothetical protein [Candidatus Anoxychlamydiales bacterium]